MRPFHRRHGGHAPGTVLLVNLPGARFPHEDGSLADVQKMRDIGGTDDVPPFEGGTLEAILHFRDVVAKLHAHGILHIYFFQNRFLSFIQLCSARIASGGRQISTSSARMRSHSAFPSSQPMGTPPRAFNGRSMMV